MNIQIEKLDKLVKESDSIFLGSEGEEVLVQLLELRDKIEEAIDEAELRLEQTALKLDPNFKSIQADKIKVYYRTYGHKYSIDDTRVNELPKNLYKTTIKYAPESKEIDKYIEENKKIPLGIIENDRKKTLTFKLKNEI